MAAKKKKTSPKKTQKNDSLLGKTVVFAMRWGLVTALWIGLFLAMILAWYAKDLPEITESMIFERRPTIIIKDNNGAIVDRYGDVKGESVTVEELPPHVIYAVLATEDRRFYSHPGLDIFGIARAFGVNVVKGGFVQGGSTITQQLAKNLFLSRERTLKRKIQEAMLALWLERKLTKDEILSAYLNRVYLGSGAYGIDAASRVYFGKPATGLTLRESAMLAGLLKAPSRYSPSADPEASAMRTQTVLEAMVDAGFIEQAQLDKLDALPPSPRRKPSSGNTYRYYTDYIVEQIEGLIGTVDKDLIVETTLDMDIQNEAEEAITKALLRYGEERKVGQGAAVVMSLEGAVVAMVGGRDYGMSEFNRATDSLRPPGSSFKPIVYLTALENGWEIDSTIVDEPITEGRYRPANFGHEYFGEITLYEALTRSLNTVAVNLMRDVHPDAAIGMARRLGITANLEPDLSLALGSSGVPIIQMATAYATIGRGGLAVDPFAIVKITDAEGNLLYEHPKTYKARQVVARKNIFDLTSMMQSVIENGTGQGAAIPYLAAGKTGTSQDFRDAWFIGFTNRYTAAVWFGNDDNSPTKRMTGGSAPAQVWREVMMRAMQKPSKSYSAFVSVDQDFSFHDLIGRIIGGSEEFNDNRRAPVQQEQYTPLGRHQWDLND